MAGDGLVVVDKPAGWTSHDVVARIRRLAGTRKVGHAGTLDPMATGVLVVGVERATRLLTYVVGADKEYRATIRLGASTTTDDAEGEVLSRTDAGHLDAGTVRAAVMRLTGTIDQVPSSVSAIKVDGRRAYARVRAGQQVELRARRVTVHRFTVHDVRPAVGDAPGAADVDVTVTCSSGTYVRALARDLGASLAVGGHLTALRRTRVGTYGLEVARTLDDLAEGFAVLPLEQAARAMFPSWTLSASERQALSFGRRLPPPESTSGVVEAGPGPAGSGSAGPVAAFGADGALVALVERDHRGVRPVLVFTPA